MFVFLDLSVWYLGQFTVQYGQANWTICSVVQIWTLHVEMVDSRSVVSSGAVVWSSCRANELSMYFLTIMCRSTALHMVISARRATRSVRRHAPWAPVRLKWSFKRYRCHIPYPPIRYRYLIQGKSLNAILAPYFVCCVFLGCVIKNSRTRGECTMNPLGVGLKKTPPTSSMLWPSFTVIHQPKK